MPILPSYSVSISVLPLIMFLFHYFAFQQNNIFSWKVLLLVLYPFFSRFAEVGFFILGFWLLGAIIVSIRLRRLHVNLFTGFIALCIGYIIVDLRLFYVMLILKEPLNRSVLNSSLPTDITVLLGNSFWFFKQYLSYGHFHTPYMAGDIIWPLALVITCVILIWTVILLKNQHGTFTIAGIKQAIAQMDDKFKALLILECIVVLFSCLAGMSRSGLLTPFIDKYIPILTGFFWGRIFFLNRVFLYLAFALCLQILLDNCFILLRDSRDVKKMGMCEISSKFLVSILLFLQFFTLASANVQYNDATHTWIYQKHKLFSSFSKYDNDFFSAEEEYNVTYKDFFAKDLFAEIKKDINYTDEKVVAFACSPAVLMYNGFNCIDGVINFYPLRYMQDFKKLIAPELEKNKWEKNDFYSWGQRLYLFNAAFDEYKFYILPTPNKDIPPAALNIDMDVFKNFFHGKYILSRAEISNADALGLALVKRYYRDDSIYTIYLYKAV
jgi:hypothetical protein